MLTRIKITGLILPVILFFISQVNCFAQGRNNIWCFGDSAGIDFNQSPPVPIVSSVRSRGSCVSISDSIGNLLFYANDRVGNGNNSTIVWNSMHSMMQNGDTLQGEGVYNELVIIPKPGSNHLYYLFTGNETYPGTEGLYYSIIDISLNGGLGEVVQRNVRMNTIPIADCLTAIKHANGRDWWLIAPSVEADSSNRFYIYLITPDSIYTPAIQDLLGTRGYGLTKLCLTKDASHLMQINLGGFMAQYDFDRCTGVISNQQIIFPEQLSNNDRYFISGAYSSNDNLFYVTTTPYTISYNVSRLVQFDLLSSNILLSADTLLIDSLPETLGLLKIAPDNKIYLSSAYYVNGLSNNYPYPDSVYNTVNMNLSVIEFPDSLGSACSFQPYSFYLGGKRTYWGLPNNPDYEMGPIVGSACDSLSNSVQAIAYPINSLNIFPNPTKNHLYIVLSGREQIKSINIYNSIGQIQQNISYSSIKNGVYVEVNTSSLSSGIYFLQLLTDKQNITRRFVKE